MPTGPPFAMPADYAQSLNGGGVDLSGTQPADGVLRSPFMQLKLKRTRVTDRLEPLEHEHLRVSDEDTANRALVAAPGHRLVVAQLDTGPQSMNGSWSKDPMMEGGTDKAEVRLVVGDRRQLLTPRPTIGTIFLVSAADGVPVRLELTDQGITQQMDLRTGATVHAGSAVLYHGDINRPSVGYAGTGTVTRGGATVQVNVKISAGRMVFEAWAPGVGWAKPGRAWLILGVTATSDGFDGYTKGGTLGVFFDIQNSSTYTLVLPGGQQIRARAGKDSTTTFGGTYSSATPVMFDVPDSLRTATLHIAPSGTVEAVQRDVRYPSNWAKAPAAQDFPIDLG
ncbi:hypothetical protein ACPPVO_20995 [Dactylosporangium sp. McL0621]|uniref:hypothetical protein n=1 Tax=Dactylosporangium sp. McL0621 TaxID=3415678 RepID=UPI003CF60D53